MLDGRYPYWYELIVKSKEKRLITNGYTIPFLIGAKTVIEKEYVVNGESIKNLIYEIKNSTTPKIAFLKRCENIKQFVITIVDREFAKKNLRSEKVLHNETGVASLYIADNFVYCLEQLLGESAISWFEAQINLETKEHIDAVVFDLERKHSILIEAKRFSNPGKKIIEVKADVERLKNPENHKVLERELRGVEIDSRYGIILADVWTGTKPKNEIYNTWQDCICNRGETVWFEKCGFEGLEIDREWKKW